MPTISKQDRPAPAANENDWTPARKELRAQSTGMDLSKSFSGAPLDPARQPEFIAETKPTEPKEATLSPQLTALARREAKFRQQEQQFKAEQSKVQSDLAELAELRQLKAKLAAKDYSAIEELVPYEDYTTHLINKGGTETPESLALKKLEAEVAAMKAANETNVSKQYEATINQYKKDIKNLVESNPEFDSIKAQKAEEHVLQYILDTFNEDGEILTVEQAAKDIEDYIVEEAMSYTTLRKVQEKLKPVQEEKRLPPPRPTFKSLTNSVTQASPSTAPRNQFQHMTPKDRIAAAIARSQKPQG